MLRRGALYAALTGLALLPVARFDWGGMAGLLVMMTAYISAAGFIVENSTARALSLFPDWSGTASALVGAVHYGTGMLGAAMVGWFGDGTPWPLGWVVALGGVESF